MGQVVTGITMSLDGFVAGPNDDVQQLFKWYFSGDTEIPVQAGRFTLKTTKKSAEVLQEAIRTQGAMITGRKNFDSAGGWAAIPRLSQRLS